MVADFFPFDKLIRRNAITFITLQYLLHFKYNEHIKIIRNDSFSFKNE